MNRIETCVLNPTAIAEAENMMVCAARLTQRADCSKFSQFTAPDVTEICGYKCCGSRCVKEIFGADNPTPERG